MKILEECGKSKLPEPDFIDDGYSFRIIFRKDILTEEYLRKLGLNERQIKAVVYVKEKGGITNKEYQELCKVKKRTASDDLKGLQEQNIFERVGTTGKGTFYVLKGQQTGKRGKKGAPKGRKGNEKVTKR